MCPIEQKIQQNDIPMEGTVRREGEQKEVRRIFKMLREIWMNIGIEKVDMHKGITVKALLDSGATGIFMDQRMAAKHGLRLQKLKRLITVRNVNGTNNSAKAITY